MKITFNFGFNGGTLSAECMSFDEADEIVRYALERGIVTVSVTNKETNAKVEVDLTDKDNKVETKPKGKVIRAYTKADIDAGEIPGVKTATPAEAAQAVKDYAAANGVEAGRALLGKFKIQRTNQITAENANAIFEATKG